MRTEELTEKNIWSLSERDAFDLILTIQDIEDKEARSRYMKIVDKAFEIRSISTRRRDLQQDLKIAGFKFFKPEVGENSNMMTGIYKRKSPGASFY